MNGIKYFVKGVGMIIFIIILAPIMAIELFFMAIRFIGGERGNEGRLIKWFCNL